MSTAKKDRAAKLYNETVDYLLRARNAMKSLFAMGNPEENFWDGVDQYHAGIALNSTLSNIRIFTRENFGPKAVKRRGR